MMGTVTLRLCSRLLPCVQLDECVARRAVPSSTGKWQRDFSVYTGLAGVALAYLRVGLHCAWARNDVEGSRAFFEKALDTGRVCLEVRSRVEISMKTFSENRY